MPTMQRKLQRVRTSTGAIGVHDAASKCYLHKGMQPLKGLVVVVCGCVVVVVVVVHGGGGWMWWWW